MQAFGKKRLYNEQTKLRVGNLGGHQLKVSLCINGVQSLTFQWLSRELQKFVTFISFDV